MDYEASMDRAANRLGFQQETGLAALKSTMVCNGGAILALLTFLGNKSAQYDASELESALTFFFFGVLLTLGGYIAGYFSQVILMGFDIDVAWNFQDDMKAEPRSRDVNKAGLGGALCLGLAVTAVVVSILCFGLGAFAALRGIL
ncbi:hypothetical protein [Sphingomonas xanthus]|uniref:Uncharacterized protein n=1 Tax=Sphingomonas xanthus TaxID=2594473 RepID=A0A516IU25_9SPHN|nr:hypothetical protein [Sphingomonas xanthus]QDP20370.1 hypothetical protein FMM02_10655 [Sphingomonas xanthus]